MKYSKPVKTVHERRDALNRAEKVKEDKIIKALQDRNLAAVAEKIGVTRSYLQAIRCGKTKLSENMRDKLTDYLNANA